MRSFIGLIVLVLAIIVSIPIGEAIQERNRHTTTINRLDEQQRAWDAEQQRALDAATFAGRVSSDYGLRVILFASTALALMYLVDSHRRRQLRIDADRRLVYPDQAGRLPVARAALEERAIESAVLRALEMWHVGEIEQKRTPLPPVTYAPHLTYHSESTGAAETVAAQLAAPASVPTFADLLSRGRVGKGNPLLLGFEAGGQELTGSWLDLYSTIVAGMSGTGKTTSQRSLACQTALHGAKFAICDPHMGAADDSLAATLAPLSACFVTEPASTDKAILDVVRYVADVGRRRVDGKDKDTTPLILWVDELTSLLGRSTVAEPLAELLEQVAQEYRKRFVFVCGSGQIFTAARTTSELRDSFASAIVHRMRRGQARMLLPTDEAAQVERLETGRAVLWRTSGATTTIAIPNTTASDVASVGRLLSADQPTMERLGKPFGNPLENGNSAVESVKPQNGEAARILSLFQSGADVPAIAKVVYGATAGRKYQEATAAIYDVLRGSIRIV